MAICVSSKLIIYNSPCFGLKALGSELMAGHIINSCYLLVLLRLHFSLLMVVGGKLRSRSVTQAGRKLSRKRSLSFSLSLSISASLCVRNCQPSWKASSIVS